MDEPTKRSTGTWAKEVVTSLLVSASEERREAERKDRLVILALLALVLLLVAAMVGRELTLRAGDTEVTLGGSAGRPVPTSPP